MSKVLNFVFWSIVTLLAFIYLVLPLFAVSTAAIAFLMIPLMAVMPILKWLLVGYVGYKGFKYIKGKMGEIKSSRKVAAPTFGRRQSKEEDVRFMFSKDM